VADFNFQGNAKQLFETFVKAPPFPLRPMIKRALTGALSKRRASDSVQPQDVIQAVHDSTPGPFLKGAIKAVSGMHKCATRCEKCASDCPLSP
jgi:hypothetical protein